MWKGSAGSSSCELGDPLSLSIVVTKMPDNSYFKRKGRSCFDSQLRIQQRKHGNRSVGQLVTSHPQ